MPSPAGSVSLPHRPLPCAHGRSTSPRRDRPPGRSGVHAAGAERAGRRMKQAIRRRGAWRGGCRTGPGTGTLLSTICEQEETSGLFSFYPNVQSDSPNQITNGSARTRWPCQDVGSGFVPLSPRVPGDPCWFFSLYCRRLEGVLWRLAFEPVFGKCCVFSKGFLSF